MDNIDWDKMDEEFMQDIKKMQKLEKQIENERQQETELVDKMTNEERAEYLKQKCVRANEFAIKNGINQKIIIPKGE